MDYKITWLNLRIVPKNYVNREVFYREILKALGLKHMINKFVNIGGIKQCFSTAIYNGIRIKLPYYETMLQQGFVLEISKKGMEFLTCSNECGAAYLLRLLHNTFLPTSDVSVIRMDIETDYIPQRILKKIPREYLKSNATLYIGSYKSNFHCAHSENKYTYVSKFRTAALLGYELLCDTPCGFENSLKDFLHNWKPHVNTVSKIVTLIEKEPSPPSATK